MIKIYQKTVKDARVRTIKRIRVGSWVHAENPTEEEIIQMVNELGLEEGLVRDGLDPYEVPRIETKDGVTYIFTRFPYMSATEITTAPLLIAVGSDFVSTISSLSLPFVETLTNKKERALLPVEFSTTQKTKLVSLFLYEIHKDYNKYLTRIRRQVRTSQVQLENISNKHIMNLVALESSLNDFLSALQPTSGILNTLLLGKTLKLYEVDRDFIEDLYLQNGQLIESCRMKLKNIINIREAYSTIMTNDLNRILRFFAALTIILTVPTILGSLYGMNVALPFADSRFAFLFVLGLAVIFSFVVYLIFSKKRWI